MALLLSTSRPTRVESDFVIPQQVVDRGDGTVWVLRTMDFEEGPGLLFDSKLERCGIDGTLIEAPFAVQQLSLEDQQFGRMAIDSNGRLAVVWATEGSSPDSDDDHSIQGRLFLATEIFFDGFESGSLEAWNLK